MAYPVHSRNTAYSIQLINTAYPLPLDTAYRSSGTETEIIDFCLKKFLPSFRTNPTDCLSLGSVSSTLLPEMQEVILFYNGLDVPTRQILDSRGAVPTKTTTDAKIAIQEMAEYSQKWHNGTSRGRSTETSDGLAAIQAQLNNLGREIKKVNEKVYAAQVGCEQL
ncbi:hypothetical protein Tco_0504752 [Tanacetum coccineum]